MAVALAGLGYADPKSYGKEREMGIRVLPYVTVEVDERLRRRVGQVADRLRVTVRSYLLSAADDVDAAGDRVRDLCDAAVHRVDTVVAKVNDRIDPAERQAEQDARVEAV